MSARVGACVWQAACLTSQIMDIIHTVSVCPGGRGEQSGAEEKRRRKEEGGREEVSGGRGEPLLPTRISPNSPFRPGTRRSIQIKEPGMALLMLTH